MKKGFTLVELLVVVVVIVTLLGVTFRLAGVGDDSKNRNTTVNRLQRLENCLSGYYAAYGSYPPVKLHGSRDYTLQVDEHGLQDIKGGRRNAKVSEDTWKQVDAACKSQPIGMTYPFNKKNWRDNIKESSSLLMESNPGSALYNFEALIEPNIIPNDVRKKSEWWDVQVFKFGVLSYLLPRFMIIMGGSDTDNSEFFTEFEQWKANNQLPPRFTDGVPFASWREVNEALSDSGGDGGIKPWMIAALPSQATCARWLQNLEEQVTAMGSTASRTYGVELKAPDSAGLQTLIVYPANGEYNSMSQQFVPDRMTMLDGWGHEYYYYSPPPHQSYRLWSAGKNGRTFPPWLTDEELERLDGGERKVVQEWVKDDIVQMSN